MPVQVDKNNIESDRKRRLEQARNTIELRIPDGSPSKSASPENIDDKKESPARHKKLEGDDLRDRYIKRALRYGKNHGMATGAIKTLGYGKGILSKYGWKEFDTYMMAFATGSSLTLLGIFLAFLVTLVLDIRVAASLFTHKVPPMGFVHKFYLAFLNIFVIVIVIIVIGVFMLVFGVINTETSITVS